MNISFMFIAAALMMAACGSNDSDADNEPDPEATGAAVWNHLQQENYQDNWPLWPGTEELYEGTEPHGMFLTIYLNDIALEAVNDGQIPLPDGAIVVKENYMPDSALAAVTTMYKVDGFNPDHNDWFWLENDPEGKIEAEGVVEMCQSCHAGADNDYIFTEFPSNSLSKNMLQPEDATEGLLANRVEFIPDATLNKTALSSQDKTALSKQEVTLIKEWMAKGALEK
ncbi:MAG: cytochrome P460 family protein [Balneolaceae bacterium]